MGISLLYVFDETCNIERFVRYCDKKNIRKIFLCPITTDQETISLLVKGFFSIKNCSFEILPYLEYFNKIAFSERNNFIHFIAEFAENPRFGSVNFKEYFKYPHSSFSVWWLSLISEKNPLKSDSYHNLVKLLTILKFRKKYKCKNIILDIKSPELSYSIMHDSKNGQYDCDDFKKNYRMMLQIVCFLLNFLKGIKYYFNTIYKIFVATVVIKRLNFRKEILKKVKYLAITYFPLIDRESLKKKKFINKYYGLLQTALENRYKDKLIWLAMTSRIDDFSFKESIKLGRQINMWSYPLYFLEEWITLKDLFIVMIQYIYFTMKCILKMPYLSKKFEYSENGINIWKIFEDDWFSSFAGGTLMSGIFNFIAFRNISNMLKTGTVVTYLAENQAWERAMNFTFHDNKSQKVIGILHTTVPLLFLTFFDSRDDLHKESETGFTMPKPDYLACNGRIPLKLFRESGWERGRTLLWFAIRYQHLKKHLQKRISWENRQNKILVVLSGSVKGAKEFLCFIHQAFRDQTDYQIIIKGHYTLPAFSLIKHLDLDFDKDPFILSDEELDRLFPLVKAVIVTGSSVALDSIAFGCPVIIPRLSSVIDMNPLSGISDLPIYVSSPKELLAISEEIIKRKESPLPYWKYKDFIENYFEFSDSENELIEKLGSCFGDEGKTT